MKNDVILQKQCLTKFSSVQHYETKENVVLSKLYFHTIKISAFFCTVSSVNNIFTYNILFTNSIHVSDILNLKCTKLHNTKGGFTWD